MATTYLRLFPAVNQFELENGQLNVAGQLKVFYEGTDDLADIYDEDGTQLEQPAILDSDGRALGLFVDSSRVYRLEVYDRFGAPIYTVRKMTPVGGGAGSAMGNRYNIVSSDGTLIVDDFDDAGVKTFDLSTHVTDGSDLMEWVAATGSTLLQGGIYRANYVDGTMEFGDRGVIMEGGRYYHVTLHMEALKNELSPVYDDVVVHLRGRDRDTGDVTEYTAVKYIVDYSMGMSQVFEVSADIFPQTNIELLVVLDGNDVAANTFSIVDMDVHRVYSGAPYIPGGVASKPWIADHYQETLVAGDNIIIDGNTISATAAPQVNADWDSNSGVTEILNKPDLSVYAEKTELEDYQEKLIPGSGITIEDNVITATAAQQLNADWDATSGVQEILNKPDLSVYAEKTELEDYQPKLTAGANIVIEDNTISATAEPQLNADWDATSGVAEILNKPDLSIYAQSSSLSTVATTGSYDDLTNKPTIVTPVNADWDSTSGLSQILNKPSEKTLVAGENVTITESGDQVTISADGGTFTQVNADWDATSGVSEILHKPDLSIYAQSSSLATVATSGSYNDLTDKPSIPSAQVNADWNATSGVAEILHKPDLSIYAQTSSLATVATTGDYSDLSNTPVIPAAQVQTDWDATSGMGQLLNKPDLSIYAESSSLATVATSGSYNDLEDKPTIPSAQVNADWDATSGIAEILNKPTLATVATTGAYSDLSGTPTISNVPDVTSNDDAKVLTASYSGGVGSYSWETVTSGGGDISVATPIMHSVDNKYYGVNTDGFSIENSGSKLPLTCNNSSMVYVYAPWLKAWSSSSTKSIILYGPSLNDSYKPRWCISSSGSTTKYLEVKTLTKQYVSSFLIYRPDGSTESKSGYSYTIPTPPYDVTNADDSVFDVVGDWSGDTAVASWYLGMYAGNVKTSWGLTTNASTTNVFIQSSNYIFPKIWASHGLGYNYYNGLYVTNPLPSATSSENGKVLGVDNGTIGWVTPAAGGVTDVEVNGTSVVSGGVADITIPVQVNADWDATSGLSQILNKPEETTLTAGENISIVESGSTLTISATAAPQQQVDWDATSGITSIANKPDLSIYAQSANLATVATTGDYADLSNTPTIPAAQVNSDWDATSGVSEILNKPDLVDIVAGPGIVVDNPDGNTLRVSQAYPTDETVLYEGTSTTTVNAEFNLSEAYTNFERIRVYAARSPSGGHAPYMSEYLVNSTYKRINYHYVAMNDNDTVQNIYAFAGELSGTKLTIKANSTKGVTTSVTNSTSSPLVIVKITGVHRIAGGN